MGAADDLAKQIRERAPSVAAEYARQSAAMADAAQAEAELLVRILEEIRPALPAICGSVEGGRGFLLIDGAAETLVREDGSCVSEPLALVRDHALVRMLETIRNRLDAQGGRARAADKLEARAKLVRSILMQLRPRR